MVDHPCSPLYFPGFIKDPAFPDLREPLGPHAETQPRLKWGNNTRIAIGTSLFSSKHKSGICEKTKNKIGKSKQNNRNECPTSVPPPPTCLLWTLAQGGPDSRKQLSSLRWRKYEHLGLAKITLVRHYLVPCWAKRSSLTRDLSLVVGRHIVGVDMVVGRYIVGSIHHEDAV
jgi:hypothetical protein